MSLNYDKYLETHRNCVHFALNWILVRISIEKLNDIFPKINTQELLTNVRAHDQSKNSQEEYEAYDNYFYSEKKTKEIEEAFDYAWLHHMHCNPHHWQYWILKEDDGGSVSGNSMTVKCLDIPDNYILEMIADWWSFSWTKYIASHDKNDLYEVFTWYENHINTIAMHPNAKQKVEDLLALIRDILDNTHTLIEIV